MVSNDDFDGKATHLNCFYLHINFEQKYPKLAIVKCQKIYQDLWAKALVLVIPTEAEIFYQDLWAKALVLVIPTEAEIFNQDL